MEAYERMIQETATKKVPWYVVPRFGISEVGKDKLLKK